MQGGVAGADAVHRERGPRARALVELVSGGRIGGDGAGLAQQVVAGGQLRPGRPLRVVHGGDAGGEGLGQVDQPGQDAE